VIASQTQATDAAAIVEHSRWKNDLLRLNLMGGEVWNENLCCFSCSARK
jgi:hypothetical protein